MASPITSIDENLSLETKSKRSKQIDKFHQKAQVVSTEHILTRSKKGVIKNNRKYLWLED